MLMEGGDRSARREGAAALPVETAHRSHALSGTDRSARRPVPTCLIVQHAPVERAYAVASALAARGVRLDVREVFAGMPVPRSASGLDGLVVMGGPASAASDDGFPSRHDELALLADAVRLGVPTIGICLGAQLLAAATGGRVFVGEAGPEIGWSPVELTVDSSSDLLLAGAPRRVTVLHWHGDTFSLPPGGVRLAANDRYDEPGFPGRDVWVGPPVPCRSRSRRGSRLRRRLRPGGRGGRLGPGGDRRGRPRRARRGS